MSGKKRSAKTVPQSSHTLTIGRELFAAISAVEGIHLSPDMLHRAHRSVSSDMSFEARRMAIIAAHQNA